MSGSKKNGKRDSAPRLDAANLAGITSLMNTQHLKPGVDLDAAEKAVMGKPTVIAKKDAIDPVQLYQSELGALADELGIDLMDDGDPTLAKPEPTKRPSPRPQPAKKNARTSAALSLIPATPGLGRVEVEEINFDVPHHRGTRAPAGGIDTPKRKPAPASKRGGSRRSSSETEDDESDETDDESDDSDDDSGSSGSSDEESCDCDDRCPRDCSCGCHEETESGSDEDDESSEATESRDMDDERVDSIIARLEEDLGIKTDDKRERRRRRLRDVDVPNPERPRGERGVTNEQDRRRHINSVVEDLRSETRTTYGVERERIQDVKASKLERIGQLRMTLDEEGIDCGGVTMPTSDSPMEEIDSVLNILRLKNDRNRYSSLAEEVILGAAEGIETVFDGTRQIPLVGWSPDYTGYSNTLLVKLHRMRGETSMVVGSIIEKYNIGPTTRIIMELLPSFFLYPRQQKKQRSAPGLANDPHITDARSAMSAIRKSDDRQSLAEARNI